MSVDRSADWLVEQRVAQLEEISQRRNVLLKQMYQMIQRKHDIGSLLPTSEDEVDPNGMNAFLERFDLNHHPENGSIATLSPDELAVPLPPPPVQTSDDADPESDDILALQPTDSEFTNRTGQSAKAKPPQNRYRLRPADQDDSDRDELDFLSSTRSPSHHYSPPPQPKSRSPSHPSDPPSAAPLSPIVIDISASRPPSAEPIAVGGSTKDEPDDVEVIDVDVDEPSVSETNVYVADGPESRTPSSTHQVREASVTQSDATSNVKEPTTTPPPDAIMTVDDEVLQPRTPSKAPSSASTEDVSMEPASSEVSRLREQSAVEESLREDCSPLIIENPQPPTAVSSAIEGPLTPVEEVIPEREHPVTPKIPPESSDAGETTTTPPPAIVDGVRSPVPIPIEPTNLEEVTTEEPSSPSINTKDVDNVVDQQAMSIEPLTESSTEDVDMADARVHTNDARSPQDRTIVSLPVASGTALIPPVITPFQAPAELHAPTISPAALFLPPLELPRRQPPTLLSGPRSPAPDNVEYVFDTVDGGDIEMAAPTTSPTDQPQYHHFDPQYTLPPLKSLPAEYQRKGKLTKAQRKREKERREREKDSLTTKDASYRDDNWAPMGMNRWSAVLSANPVYAKVSKATKCLLTKDWGTAFTELRLVRTFGRIENLKDAGRWSFRQPKKQRGVGGLTKTHWDYLMDEMKWMRTDFREERRWKLALAYNLATAVLDWHAAGNAENRLALGICVKWKRPPACEPPAEDSAVDVDMAVIDVDAGHQTRASEATEKLQDSRSPSEPRAQQKPLNPLSILNYNSDDDDDEEQDQGQDREQSVADALDASGAIDDHFDSVARMNSVNEMIEAKSTALQPKTEDTEDTSALQNDEDAMEVDRPTTSDQIDPNSASQQAEQPNADQSALKTDSANPMLTSATTSRSSDEPSVPTVAAGASKSALKQIFAPVREAVAYSELDKLFLDFDDLDISKTAPREPTANDVASLFDSLLPPAELSTVFPDLQPYGMLEVAQPSGAPGSDNKKKSDKKSDRDDPNKRAEDATYSKLVPIGKYMHCKPTLLGPLQPSKTWKNGEWRRLDQYVIVAEDNPPTKPLDIFSDLFENNKPLVIPPVQLHKDYRRTSEAIWTPDDDAILKSLIERYPYNWPLIAECFNSTRATLSNDKRTPRDFIERCDALFGASSQNAATAEGSSNTPMTPSTQMTTRKRLASVSTSNSNMPYNASEPRKRRRHLLVHEAMRKLTKTRLATAQKNASIAQRKSSVVHETHAQYNKLPVHTPAELGRIKVEKEARESAELATVKRKQEEMRAQQMRLLVANNGQQQGTIAHTPQVGIAQHQRISTPANSRLSPQQVAQAQAHLQRNMLQTQQQQQGQQVATQSQAQALAQVQQQAQGQAQNGTPAVNGTVTSPGLAPNPMPSTSANVHTAYGSPPRSTSTPSNAAVAVAAAVTATSPRPQSAQTQQALLHAAQLQQAALQQQANALQRQPPAMGYYMAPNGTPYTAEQLNTMRLQLMQQQAAQAQAAQAQAQAQAQQHIQQQSSAQGQ